MEEILASIRRIIADDGRAAARTETPIVVEAPQPAFQVAAVRETAFAAPRPAPIEIAVAPPTVASLAPDRPANAEPARYAPAPPRPESFERLTMRLGAPRFEEPAPAPAPSAEEAPAHEATFDLGEAIMQAVTDDLAVRSVAVEPAPVAEPPAMLSREADAAVAAQFGRLSEALMANNAQRLDEMTRQMLRPLLKSWLDDNLPVLVERLVRAEIERVARGGR